MRKLTDAQVIDFRKRAVKGETVAVLAREGGVDRKTMMNILANRTYADVVAKPRRNNKIQVDPQMSNEKSKFVVLDKVEAIRITQNAARPAVKSLLTRTQTRAARKLVKIQSVPRNLLAQLAGVDEDMFNAAIGA